jgi:hypothetical protein
MAMTEEIKRYQDMIGGNGLPDEGTAPPGSTPAVASDGTVPPPPIQTNDQYFVARQQVFVAKEVVILSPTYAYAPASPETIHYVSVVTPAATQVRTYEVANPGVRTWNNTWSGYAAHARAPFRGVRPHPGQMRRQAQPKRRRRKWH